MLVTKPNHYQVITIGNLEALCDHLLQGKGLARGEKGDRHQEMRLFA